MSTGAPTVDHMTTSRGISDFAQGADKVSLRLRQRSAVRGGESPIWQQIDDLLRRSLGQSGFWQPDVVPEREYPPPRKRLDAVVVAPGILVWGDEYEQRYGGIDLEKFRQRMSPDLFKAFVRHVGSIPGYPDLDVNEITSIPD